MFKSNFQDLNSIPAFLSLEINSFPRPTAEVRTPPYWSPPGKLSDLAKARADSHTNFEVDL